MTDIDLNRYNIEIICNKCKDKFHPYPESVAPILDEVACPKCGEKRILYFGENLDTQKMMLSTYGVNKELNERLDRLEGQIGSLKEMVKTSLDDARNIMTKALIGSLKEQLSEHEKNWHGGSFGKQQKP